MCIDIDNSLGRALLVRARNAIAGDFGMPSSAEPAHDRLREPGATFVTLTQHGALRGCIGSLEAVRPLEHDVCANARAAAFRDPRFAPLVPDELPITRLEVSLLGRPEAMQFGSEEEALCQLQPNLDGVILHYGGQRSTFLPQVWEMLPAPREFLAQLKRKAGLAGTFWADTIRLSRYRVDKWQEE